MQLKEYIRYFRFIGSNWNYRIAAFVLLGEVIGEATYRLHTTGCDDLQEQEDLGIDITHASVYMPINYYILGKLMREIRKYPDNGTFLDLGCGKGRALAVAAYFGFDKITGVDFSRTFCEAAMRATRSCSDKFPSASFRVIHQDAFYYEWPAEVTTVFLFNPFDEVIMSGVVSNMRQSLQENPRTLRILYANPVYQQLFLDEGFRVIYHVKKMEYLEAVILQFQVEE